MVVAGINLDWMSKIMANSADGRASCPCWSIAPVVVLARRRIRPEIGRPLDNMPLLSAIADRALSSSAPTGSLSFTATDGSKRAISSPNSRNASRLIVSIDETKVTAAIDREIRTAYLQLGFVCLFVLLGALIGAEKLISPTRSRS